MVMEVASVMQEQQLKETYLSSEEIFDGKIIHVQRWQVMLPDGKTAPREIVLHPGAAAVVPVDEDGNVTLVRQHRVAIDKTTYEIPAGKLDAKGEDPFLCAKRELEEETGLHAENWQLLTTLATTPGFCNERIAIYLATSLSQHQQHTDEDEFLNLVKMPLQEAVAHCMNGDFTDGKTIVGLLMAERVLNAHTASPLFDPANIQRASAPASSRCTGK